MRPGTQLITPRHPTIKTQHRGRRGSDAAKRARNQAASQHGRARAHVLPVPDLSARTALLHVVAAIHWSPEVEVRNEGHTRRKHTERRCESSARNRQRKRGREECERGVSQTQRATREKVRVIESETHNTAAQLCARAYERGREESGIRVDAGRETRDSE